MNEHDPEESELRDMFAAMVDDDSNYSNLVMATVVGRDPPDRENLLAVMQFEADFRAKWRYMRADAMLKARGEQQS